MFNQGVYSGIPEMSEEDRKKLYDKHSKMSFFEICELYRNPKLKTMESDSVQATQPRKIESVISMIYDLKDQAEGIRNRLYSLNERVNGVNKEDSKVDVDAKLQGQNGLVGLLTSQLSGIKNVMDVTNAIIAELEKSL